MNYQELIEHGSLFLPVCQFFKEELKKLGFQKKKIKVLYGGIDIDRFTFRKCKPIMNNTFKILSVGRLVQKKGFPILIRAFRELTINFQMLN